MAKRTSFLILVYFNKFSKFSWSGDFLLTFSWQENSKCPSGKRINVIKQFKMTLTLSIRNINENYTKKAMDE